MVDRIDVDVWLWALGADFRPPVRWGALLADDERARMQRFKFEADRQRFLICRSWMRRILARYTGQRAGELKFTYGKREKPALAGEGGLAFNLSHTSGLAGLAVCRGHTVGFDLERLRPIEADFAEYVLSAEELQWLGAQHEAERSRGFLQIWTAKESLIKATGEGLFQCLRSFEAAPARAVDQQFIEGRFHNLDVTDARNWRLFSFAPGPDHVGGLVVDARANADVRIRTRRIGVTAARS